jgi:DNA invertase Pin-like site-specific DNA recombinase
MHRPELRRLLEEVVRGSTSYRAILVFDVSRWGRFQDTDEAAHYEFVCKSAGIPIHYCAEPFSNTASMSDSLFKTIKRFMAGEYSRDLSARTLGGIKHIVQRGFKYGSTPGYGLRRMLVAADGTPKQLLGPGERKSISSDRVMLVGGTPKEQACVREIYRLFVEDKFSLVQIAHDLNRRSVPITTSNKWNPWTIKHILTHPKYTGALVFGRTERKLQSPPRRTDRSQWVVTPNAFQGIVDQETFGAAQQIFATFTRKKSNQQLLEDLRELLAEQGKLSVRLLRESSRFASPQAYIARWGSVHTAYRLIGYEMSSAMCLREHLASVRNQLVRKLSDCFPGMIHRVIRRSMRVRFTNGPQVLVRVCKSRSLKIGRRWALRRGCDGSTTTVLALMDQENCEIETLYVVPNLQNRDYSLSPDDDILEAGIRLNDLSELPAAVKSLEAAGS